MGLKTGYRQTQVGVIPEDWELTTLGAVCDTSSGTTPPRALMDRYYRDGSIPWVKTLDLNNSNICSTDESVTELALKETSLRSYPVGTVLVAMYGGFNQIGRTGLLRISAAVNQAITAIRPRSGSLVPEYLIRNLNYRIDYWKSVASSSRKDPNITGKDVRDFEIPLPKPHEQEAIAGVLSDADALMESLEQLIAKKRHLKQGAMQELLTGKKRLPGFGAEWEVKRLGEICDIAMGRTPPRLNKAFWGRGYKWLAISDLWSKVVKESKEEITELAASGMQIIARGTLLMSFKLSIGRLCFAGCDLFTNEAICSFNNLQASAEFLYYALGRTDFSLYGKQAVKGYTLNKESLRLIEVRLPSEEEQTAIAAVLSDMDAEIAALGAKLAKARQIKQGMMHNLLTGRIRLV
jgi:type I restriction enzyme S subunit